MSGDRQLLQVLRRAAADPSQVAAEVVAAAVGALGDVIAGQVDGTQTVRRVIELEQSVAGYERSGPGAVCLSRLALEAADAARLSDQVRGPTLRDRLLTVISRLHHLLVVCASSLGLVNVVAAWTAIPSQAAASMPTDLAAEGPWPGVVAPPDATAVDEATAATVDGSAFRPQLAVSGGNGPRRHSRVRPQLPDAAGTALPSSGPGRDRRRRHAAPWARLRTCGGRAGGYGAAGSGLASLRH